MNFIVNKETNELIEFYFNTKYFENYNNALQSFVGFMHILLPYLQGFKVERVKQTIQTALDDSHLCASVVEGENLFSADYDEQLTLNILTTNKWFDKGASFPSQFLIKPTVFLAGDKEHNKAMHSKAQEQSLEYFISDSLHFIKYPCGKQQIVYFD